MMTFIAASSLFVLVSSQTHTQNALFEVDEASLRKAYAFGRDAAKKKIQIEKLIDPFLIDLGRVRSPKGMSWPASSALLIPPLVSCVITGFNDAREYKDSSAIERLVYESMAVKENMKERRILMFAPLYAWPGINDYNHSINRPAKQADVRDAKFVILVDGEPEKAIHPLVKPTPESETKLDGTVSIPEYHTIVGGSSGSASGNSGNSTSTGNWNSTSYVTYATNRIESYAAYSAQYMLQFPYANQAGLPYFSSTNTKLVLKVIYSSGEHTGVWDLKALKKFTESWTK